MLNDFLAKKETSKKLFLHCVEAGCIAKIILSSETYRPTFMFLFDNCDYEDKTYNNLLSLLATIVATHDIGKCNIKFQLNALENIKLKHHLEEIYKEDILYEKTPVRHELYGADLFSELSSATKWNDAWSSAITIHHQRPNSRNCLNSDLYPYLIEHEKNTAKTLINEIKEYFEIDFDTDEIKCTQYSAWWTIVVGVMILSDWIASSKWFELNTNENAVYIEWLAKKTVNRLGIIADTNLEQYDSFENMFEIKTEKMRGIQKAVDEVIPTGCSFVCVEAAPGEGKTESGLWKAIKEMKAQNKTGLYVGLPTGSTSYQTYKRLKKALHGSQNINLVYSGAAYLDDNAFFLETSDLAFDWFSSTKKGLLCPFSVGTVDQAELAVLKVKQSMLRLLGLSNKVVILDEVHSYDAYISDIIVKLLSWLKVLSVPVIILSATLPDTTKEKFIHVYDSGYKSVNKDYPLITYVIDNKSYEKSCDSFKNQTFRFRTADCLEKYEKYIDEVKKLDAGCIAITTNTVKGAQEVFKIAKAKLDESYEIYLLHSKYTAEDRQSIERKLEKILSKDGIVKRPRKILVISTQILEQSLDYDFDYMLTEIAPIDLLIQRAGRVKRFEDSVMRNKMFNNKEIDVCVFVPNSNNFGTSGMVYYELLLKRTMDYIEKNKEIHVLKDVRGAINYVYDDEYDHEMLNEWVKKNTDENLKILSASDSELPLPNGKNEKIFYVSNLTGNPSDFICKKQDDENATTRDASKSLKIVFVKNKKEIENAENNKSLAKKMHEQAIPVNYSEDKSIISGKKYLSGLSFIVGKEYIAIEKKIYKYDKILGLIHQ